MGEDVLSKVVSAEKEIQQRLELEKAKAQEWLDKEKDAEERKLLEEEKKIKEEFNKTIERAVQDAEYRASKMMEEAGAEAERLDNLDDESLIRIILSHIGRILPEKTP